MICPYCNEEVYSPSVSFLKKFYVYNTATFVHNRCIDEPSRQMDQFERKEKVPMVRRKKRGKSNSPPKKLSPNTETTYAEAD